MWKLPIMGKDRGPGGSTSLRPFLGMNVQMMDPRSSRKKAKVSGDILEIDLAKEERLECWRLEGFFFFLSRRLMEGVGGYNHFESGKSKI